MVELDESLKHQEKISKTIEEFKKGDELLKDYTNKFSEITREISDLESELIVWKKEKKDLRKNPANKEEVEIWDEQITLIETNIKVKLTELNEYQRELDDLNIKKKFLIEDLRFTEVEHIEYLVNQFHEYFKYSVDDLHLIKCRKVLVSNLNLLKALWEILDKDSDLTAFVKFFKSNEIEIDLTILTDMFRDLYCFIGSEVLFYFLNEYSKNFNINTIVDPCCNIGSLIFHIVTEDESELTAFSDDPKDEEVFNLLYPNKPIQFKNNFDELQKFQDNHFDVVLGFSDLHQNGQIVFNSFNFYDVLSTIRFFQGCLKLKKDGVAFFISSPEFSLNCGCNSVFTCLEKYGLHIDSIIRLAGEIFPENNSNKTLIIIKRKKPEKIFVGELNKNSSDILLKNLKNRKSGKIPQHGSLTELESFYSFHNLLAKYESQDMALSTGLEPLRFEDIVVDIRCSEDFSETEKDFNYLFLPFDLGSNAITSSKNIEDHSHLNLQIFLDQEIALSDYVAHFFNTQLGKKIRESISTDSRISKVWKKLLLKSFVYLPDLDTQIEIVRVNSSITELTTRAESYKGKLWKSPLKVSDIQKEIEDMDDGKSEEKFEQWIESLPYPLASIVWCSITNPSYERKVKYLLHFFEAFSEFNMALLLSGLSSDENFFEVEVKRCFRDDPRFKNWYFKPTFGNWYKFGSCLSKTVRRLLEENKTKCLEVFGNPDPEFLRSIAHKDLITISEEVSNYRNQWEGHGPVVSEKEYINRYKILRSVLSRVYQILSDTYENTFLILPLQSSFQDGVHNYSIKRYMSTRAPFKPDNIETIKLMDKSKIYLAHENQRNPVELLPFVINVDGACYFYNGRDHDIGKARYVSYHYHEKPEILLPMDKFNQVISLLKP